MDDTKDISNNIAAFAIFDGNIRTNPFGRNQSALRVYRRVERLVAALYLITNHVPVSEPARNAIRSECLELIERSLMLRDDMSITGSQTITDIKGCVRHLVTLVRMLTVAGVLSTRNAQIAIEALDDLAGFVEVSRVSPSAESVTISKEDFLDIRRTTLTDIKDTLEIKDKRLVKDSGVDQSNTPTSSIPMSLREQHILGYLTGVGEVGIRDIVSSLPEYSEKMIQRELASLVSAGRVKKTGLKRWSRYSAMV